MASFKRQNPRGVKLLVINPNSSKVMTQGLDNMISDLGYHESIQIHTYTAPSGPDSINNENDAHKSAEILLPVLHGDKDLSTYAGFLVACYSVHPLTERLPSILPSNVPVVGIFEASISTALSLLRPTPPTDADGTTYKIIKFGIVTTGTYWEETLTKGVMEAMGVDDVAHCKRFKGVSSTGLSAGELHTAPAEEVRRRMKDATKSLVQDGDVSVVCLGCAGMAGMDEMVREACVEALGEEGGAEVRIVDGVKAGIAILDGLVRSGGP